jgi:DNA-binding response OmpR family regulator
MVAEMSTVGSVQWTLRVLVVEDDRTLVRLLKQALAEDGYEVETASTADDGFHMAMRKPFDVMVIDVGLGSDSGIELIERLRRVGVDTPVLVLTSHSDSETTISGLDAGADDYVVKPVPLDVLEARIRALHRRWAQPKVPVRKVGDLTLDVTRLVASRRGFEIDLTPTQARVLEVLMERVGQVVDRLTIAERASDNDALLGSNVIDVHIRSIRKKIDEPFDADTIETVRGMGYRVRRP